MNLNQTKQHREITQIELVETYNITLALKRVHNSGSYHHLKWKRALYHALSMSAVANDNQLQGIRQALELP